MERKGTIRIAVPDKDKIPKDQWAVKKGMHLYCKKTSDKKEEEKDEKQRTNRMADGSTAEYSVSEDEGKIDLENDILLDTGATFSSFHNKDLIMNVRDTTNSPIKMKTNVGSRRINEGR